jgi:hypothetical protein
MSLSILKILDNGLDCWESTLKKVKITTTVGYYLQVCSVSKSHTRVGCHTLAYCLYEQTVIDLLLGMSLGEQENLLIPIHKLVPVQDWLDDR